MQKKNMFFFSFPGESAFLRQQKGTNKRGNYQIYLQFSKREYYQIRHPCNLLFVLSDNYNNSDNILFNFNL